MSSVFVAGPASWNTLVVLDRLPEPVPHMQFAEESWETVGGTSAGKALSLAALGRDALLYAISAIDEADTRVCGALAGARVPTLWADGTVTARHLNLMTRAGERVSVCRHPRRRRTAQRTLRSRRRCLRPTCFVLDLAAEPLHLPSSSAGTGPQLARSGIAADSG